LWFDVAHHPELVEGVAKNRKGKISHRDTEEKNYNQWNP
jgi:hypothetical protein